MRIAEKDINNIIMNFNLKELDIRIQGIICFRIKIKKAIVKYYKSNGKIIIKGKSEEYIKINTAMINSFIREENKEILCIILDNHEVIEIKVI